MLAVALLVGLVGCSRNERQPAKPAAKQSFGLHEYSVTLAAVKIPDETLKRLALPSFEEVYSQEASQKLAAYVVAHSGDFSLTTIKGNCLPVVWNNGETHVKLLPDPKQEEKDFETLGLTTRPFDVCVSVREEDGQGWVYSDWRCSYGVHLKEPVGNSTDHGGSLTCGPGFAPVGQTNIWRLFHGKGVSLWMLGALNRNTNQ
jgi:hypothetical protein